MGALGALLAALALAACASAVKFDPCTDETALSKAGSGFTIGVAYWPGSQLLDWGDPDTGPHPCPGQGRSYDQLKAAGVMFGVYNSRVDRFTNLKLQFAEQLSATIGATNVTTMTAVAFRGKIRSPPIYLIKYDDYSNSNKTNVTADPTTGVGFVTTMSLLARFEKGNLKYLSWYDMTCADCGGPSGLSCVNQTLDSTVTKSKAYACAKQLYQCSCYDQSGAIDYTKFVAYNFTNTTGTFTESYCPYNNFTACSTSINLSYEGTDVAQSTFSTASQVKRLNAYSIVALYTAITDVLYYNSDSYFAQASSSYKGTWGSFRDTQVSFSSQYAAPPGYQGKTIGTTPSGKK